MLLPLLLTTGSEMFHYSLLFTSLHAMNEVKQVAKAVWVDFAISLHVGL